MGLVGCLGTLYSVGGFTAPHYLSTCEAYDPNADQWWGVAPLGTPRRDLGLAAIEHRHMLNLFAQPPEEQKKVEFRSCGSLQSAFTAHELSLIHI